MGVNARHKYERQVYPARMPIALRTAYTQQRKSSRLRGIEWLFTPETWLVVWELSGRLSERGNGLGKYVMTRPGDSGPYSEDNVRIRKHEENVREARQVNPRSTLELSERAIGRGRGWCMFRGRFRVSVARKWVGDFRSQTDAESAYREAVEQRRAEIASAALSCKETAQRLIWETD